MKCLLCVCVCVCVCVRACMRACVRVCVWNDRFFLLILCTHNFNNLAVCFHSESYTAITYIIKCIFNPECAVDFLFSFLAWLTLYHVLTKMLVFGLVSPMSNYWFFKIYLKCRPTVKRRILEFRHGIPDALFVGRVRFYCNNDVF